MFSIAIRFALSIWLAVAATAAIAAPRLTQSLNGMWHVGESADASVPPSRFDHRVPVPGLLHSAQPAFEGIDRFESRSFLANMVFNKLRPAAALVTSAGVSNQSRNYFWYRTNFTAPARREAAFLKVGKAQFGSEIWVNGRRLGMSSGCAASRTYAIGDVVRWSAQNSIVIRIGAHPGVLPVGAPCGVDMEKTRWTPGIYDDVSVFFTDAVMIETVQAAPHLSPRGVKVQLTLRNLGEATVAVPLRLAVHAWKSATPIAQSERSITVLAGKESVVTLDLPLPTANLWSPETPNLYVIESVLGADRVTTRFGLREFRFDTASRLAYLNGHPYFLRGSNIALHRFFEDPLSARLPWNEAWVTKLLGPTTKSMHWNAMRLTIGPVPDRWLEIADEQGLILQQEFPIWNSKLIGTSNPTFNTPELVDEFSRWMRDSWNHPSVAIWDASNETELAQLARDVIPAVRPLDLSRRAWENSYNAPQGPDDPVEDHPYEFVTNEYPELGPAFDMTQLETRSGAERSGRTVPTGHAMILNEYGWLWLNRDGSPTRLTQKTYAGLPYPTQTADERLRTQAYLLAGLTEYWRAWRRYAGVMHFVYLTGEVPGGFTSDNFSDVRSLTLNRYFRDYVGEAFRPLGVYINFWHRQLSPGDARDYTVMLVNDAPVAASGELTLSVKDAAGKVFERSARPFEIAPSGQSTLLIHLTMPSASGDYSLVAEAHPVSDADQSTISRRWITLAVQK